jgi:glycosyltransferase involved in cell wall biosynthesis
VSGAPLRVGVPAGLLSVAADSGHGKVWNRVLAELGRSARLVAIGADGRPTGRLPRRPGTVVLADGHAPLPATSLPLVVQVHEASWFDPTLRELLNREFTEDIARRTATAVSRAAHVITPSQAARRAVAAAYSLDLDRVHAVHHGVDPGFRPGLPGGRELVARARGGAEAPYVLYAAVLHPRKNLAVLRAAMGELAGAGLPHVLAIAGRPPGDGSDALALERAATAELPGAPGRVAALGAPSDDELARLMAGAAAFCLPSLYEGFGLTPLEAMACGAPVIVSDRGALPEVVGDAGVIVPPTVTAVTEALRRVLGDPDLASRLSTGGVHRARGFTWERTAAGWLEVLRSASGAPYTRAG